MIKRFVTAFGRRVTGLHEAAYVLAFFALVSQVLALVRDRLLAHFFGASATLDIYYAAFRIPDLVFVSVASIVSLFVLIPFISERMTTSVSETRSFISRITSVFFVAIVVASAVLFMITPILIRILYPGITAEAAQNQLITLTRILLLSPILLGLSNILASVTQVVRKFSVYALSPVVYNVGIIIGIIALYPLFGLRGLGYGVVLGAVLHMAIQIPTVMREGLLPNFTWRIDWPEVRHVIGVSLPRTIALSLQQISILVLLALASLMPEGSIAVFNFALNLQAAPLSIIGVSYSVAAFPTLAYLFSRGDNGAFLDHMITAIRHILFWAFPAIVLFIVLRAQIVRVILGSGSFDWADTRLTAAALALFMISLVAHSLMLLFVRGYYATGRTGRPLIVNSIASGVIILSGVLGVMLFTTFPMVQYFIEALFRVGDIPGTVILILPLSYSLGMIVNALIFWFMFRRDFGGHLPRFLYTTTWQSLSASIIGGGAAYIGLQFLAQLINLDTLIGILIQGAGAGIIGLIVIVLVLVGMKNVEVQEIWQALHTKFWKSEAVIPETEEL